MADHSYEVAKIMMAVMEASQTIQVNSMPIRLQVAAQLFASTWGKDRIIDMDVHMLELFAAVDMLIAYEARTRK